MVHGTTHGNDIQHNGIIGFCISLAPHGQKRPQANARRSNRATGYTNLELVGIVINSHWYYPPKFWRKWKHHMQGVSSSLVQLVPYQILVLVWATGGHTTEDGTLLYWTHGTAPPHLDNSWPRLRHVCWTYAQ